jgi:hypothetical protein
MPNEWSKNAVETLERVADGLCDSLALKAASDSSESVLGPNPHGRLREAQSHALSAAVTCLLDREYRLAGVASGYCLAASTASHKGTRSEEDMRDWMKVDCNLIRDLLGNPFRPVKVKKAWLTWNARTIPAIAQAIYDDRTFDRLPILADALEEAGCDNADMLSHLRGPGPHVRGCWAVDLILGKA